MWHALFKLNLFFGIDDLNATLIHVFKCLGISCIPRAQGNMFVEGRNYSGESKMDMTSF